MRLFITSYQKAGTHQIMPAFGATEQVVGRAYVDMAAVRGYGMTGINHDGIDETCDHLRRFEEKAFGHLPYLPEYAEAIQAQPTKVLFNVRDPRDVVVANYYSIQKVYYKTDPPGKKGLGHLNLADEKTGELVILKKDPIAALIEIEAYRWPAWLGWLNHDFVMKVKYEDLRLAGIETLKKILEFTMPYSFHVYSVNDAMVPNHANPTFRSGRIGDWKTEFKPHHKKLAEKLMGKTIERLGYEI
jgi:hypothetical protein